MREKGKLEERLQFFLTAVAHKQQMLSNAPNGWPILARDIAGILALTRYRVAEVVELLMANPFVTVRNVQDALGVTQPGPLNLLRGIEGRGWLREAGTFGRFGRIVWVAPEVLAVLTDLPEISATQA